MSKRAGIQLCYPFEERRLTEPKFGWTAPYLIQPKLDGDRCRAVISSQGEVTLYSSEMNTIQLPHIRWALEDTGLRNIELDGELYTHMMSHEEIRSRVGRTVNPHKDSCAVQLHVFDLVLPDKTQVERTLALEDLRKVLVSDAIQVVTTDVVTNMDAIMKKYDQYIEQGYEGFVLRDSKSPYLRRRNSLLMKFKPKKSDWYRIVGFEEEISILGEPKDALGALVLDSALGNTCFKVGTGFSREQRIELWKERHTLIGKVCHVQYQAMTSAAGVPRFPVFVEIITPEAYK
jgi:ATP-dependent DNA ligase